MNKYLESCGDGNHSLFNLFRHKPTLKHNLHVALTELVEHQVPFPNNLADELCGFLHEVAPIFSKLTVGDIRCIFWREMQPHRFPKEWKTPNPTLIRLDGPDHRMTWLSHMLWNLTHTDLWERPEMDGKGALERATVICVDVCEDTIKAHQKCPIIDEAIHCDVFTYVLEQLTLSDEDHGEGHGVTLYLDFCSMPRRHKNLRDDLVSHSEKVASIVQRFPQMTVDISYCTMGWKAASKDSRAVWRNQLRKQKICVRKADSRAQKHMFETINVSPSQSPSSVATLSLSSPNPTLKRSCPSHMSMENGPAAGKRQRVYTDESI